MDYFHSLFRGGYSQELQQLQIKKKKRLRTHLYSNVRTNSTMTPLRLHILRDVKPEDPQEVN